jgi:DNA-binding sugar fermentation-stimulating protein
MILEMLRTTRMDKQFMMYPDAEQARASFHLRPM